MIQAISNKRCFEFIFFANMHFHSYNTVCFLKKGLFFSQLISCLYMCRSYSLNTKIFRRKVISNYIEFSVSLLVQTLRKTRSIDLLSLLGAQLLSVRRRCCTVSMARIRFALLVVCDSQLLSSQTLTAFFTFAYVLAL